MCGEGRTAWCFHPDAYHPAFQLHLYFLKAHPPGRSISRYSQESREPRACPPHTTTFPPTWGQYSIVLERFWWMWGDHSTYNDWKLIAHPESYSCWCSSLCPHSSSSCSPMLLSAGTEDGEGKATHMKALGAIIPPWKVLIQVENRATVDAGLLSISFCGTEVSLPVQEPRISRTELAPADHFILQT